MHTVTLESKQHPLASHASNVITASGEQSNLSSGGTAAHWAGSAKGTKGKGKYSCCGAKKDKDNY